MIRMRIAIIDTLVTVPGVKGIAGQTALSDIIWSLGNILNPLDDEVHIIGPYESDVYPDRVIIVHRYKIPPFVQKWKGLGWLIKSFAVSPKKACRELRKIKNLDLVHVFDAISPILLGLSASDIPTVYTPATCVYQWMESSSNPWGAVGTPIFWSINLTAARLSPRIIATTRATEECWKKCGARSSKISRIPYGVNTSIFRPIPNDREYLGLDVGAKIVTYVGRLAPEKGVKYFLESIKNLKEIKEIQLHIIGEGEQKKRLIHYARELDIQEMIYFHRWVPQPNLPLFYSASDVIVVPSLIDSSPRTLTEEMACKVPVVGTNVGGIPDQKKDRKTGLLAPSENSMALTLKIREILQNKEFSEEIAVNGYEYIRQNLDWKIIGKRIREEIVFKDDFIGIDYGN